MDEDQEQAQGSGQEPRPQSVTVGWEAMLIVTKGVMQAEDCGKARPEPKSYRLRECCAAGAVEDFARLGKVEVDAESIHTEIKAEDGRVRTLTRFNARATRRT